MEKDYKEIIEKEKILLSSSLRGDVDVVGYLLADDFFEIGMTGMRFDKTLVLANLENWDYLEYEGVDFEVRDLGEKLVQVIYKALVRNKKQNTETWTRRSSMWEKKSDGWKMIFHQGTKIVE